MAFPGEFAKKVVYRAAAFRRDIAQTTPPIPAASQGMKMVPAAGSP
jgi:hypothetical protein